MRITSGYRVLLLVIMLFIAGRVSAQQFEFSSRRFSSRKSVPNIMAHTFPDTIIVLHDWWTYMLANPTSYGNSFKFKSVHDLVRFYINHDTPISAKSYTYEACIKVLGFNNPSDTTHPVTYFDTLTVSYARDSLQPYSDLFIKKYSGFHKMKVIITGIYDITTMPPVLLTASGYTPKGLNCDIECEVWQQKYDKTPYGGSYPIVNGTTGHNNLISFFNGSTNGLQVNFWDSTVAPPAPALYELEWTYVDNYSYNVATGASGTFSASQLNYDFKSNATRVITNQPSYTIPVIYEKGYLVFRARIVRPDSTLFTTPVYTDWSVSSNTGLISSLTSGTNYYQITQSHTNDSLNWQYTASYAEDGKYKQVMNYFDGALKDRQTVTRLNSNPNYIIATENIYDFKGRPEINILPTPVSATSIQYVNGLSINSRTNKPYQAADFDTLPPPGTCPTEYGLSPLASTALAYKYYSNLNPDTAGYQKYVPNAGGYPMIHTIIAPENDKRILKQGGAGPKLQMGNNVTSYDYVMPEQSELNRLFGTQAGYSEYYQKAVATDPNGELTYTIATTDGKTVVKGMIGSGIDSVLYPVDPLMIPVATSINEDLLEGMTQIPVNNTWTINKDFFVEAPGNHTLQYALTIPAYQVCTGKYLNVSASYAYWLYDNCGNLKLSNAQSLGKTGISSSGTASSLTGSPATAYLNVGKEILYKTMHVSRDSIAAAVDSFMANPGTCLNNINYFIRNSVESKQFPCPGTSYCDRINATMKADLTPGGRYAQYFLDSTGAFNPSLNTSLYNPNSIFTVDGLGHVFYQRCSALAWPSPLVVNGSTYTNISSLPVDTFITYFSDVFAQAMLPLHPEYCKRCNDADYQYETILQSIPDYQTAQQLGYLTLDSIIKQDPMYFSGYLPYDTLAHTRLFQKRLDSICISLAFCGGVDSTQSRICQQQIFNGFTTAGNYNILTAPAVVKESYFKKLIPFYLANREGRMQARRNVVSNGPPCTTCGQLTFVSPSVYGFLDTVNMSDSATVARLFVAGDSTLAPPTWMISSFTGSAIRADSVAAFLGRNKLKLCDTQVAHIAQELVNCSLDTNIVKAIRDSLGNYYCTGTGINQPYTPDVVRRVLHNIGLSLSDLCNPYLVDYTPLPTPTGDAGTLTCKTPTFYSDARSFFNLAGVQSSINNRTSVYVPLSASNSFALAIADTFGHVSGCTAQVTTTYDNVIRQYQIVIKDSLNPANRINFWMKKMDSTGICTQRMDSLNYWSVANVMCLKSDISGLYPSQINAYTCTAYITSVSGTDTERCHELIWNDRMPLMDTGNDGETYACITCPEIKRSYTSFKDTLAAYGLCCTDHPFYSTMLRNYVNYTMGKEYSDDDIMNFLASCAVADSIAFYNLYGQFRIGNMADADITKLIDSLNSIYGTSVDFFKYRTSGMTAGHYNLLLSFNGIPANNLLAAKNYVLTNFGSYGPSYSGSLGNDTLAVLFVPTSLTLPTGWMPPGIALSSPTGVTVSFAAGAGLGLLSYNMYALTYTSLLQYQLLQATDSVVRYVNANTYGAQLYTRFNPLIDDKYYLQIKKDFLTYNYSLTDTIHQTLIAKLRTDSLQAHISDYTYKSVTYDNPYQPGDQSDLFVSDTAVSGYTGYQTAAQMLSKTAYYNPSSYNPDSSIFLKDDSVLVYSSGGTMGDRILAFKCGDGSTYWYRKFENSTNNLYNLFVTLPAYIGDPGNWHYDGLELGAGNGPVYRFKVHLTSRSHPGLTAIAYGYSDFSLGTSTELENSLLCRGMYDQWNPIDTMTCERQRMLAAVQEGRQQYLAYIDSIRNQTISDYTAFLDTAIHENVYLTTRDQKYMFTLYYYDRAGNLERTVSPVGVVRLDSTIAVNDTVDVDRDRNTIRSLSLPVHTKSDYYQYNSLNELVQKTTTNGGTVNYYYDAIGRVVFSQNDIQRGQGNVTYTLYDEQGRVIETGQEDVGCPPLCDGCYPSLPLWVTNSSNYSLQELHDHILQYTRTEVVATLYDNVYKDLSTISGMSAQQNLRKRVSMIKTFTSINPLETADTSNRYDYATYYSYDIEGNIKTLTHEFVHIPLTNQVFKRVDYDYDMLSGKVNLLSYDRGFADQFYQRYTYDADNRLTKTETSKDGLYWDDDADYQYYEHGPLARLMLGDLRVQGVDYAYTIQGWLKVINSDIADSSYDMGADGTPSSIFPKDVYSLSLGHFNSDYTPIGKRHQINAPDPAKSLYNGDINSEINTLRSFGNLYRYFRYDPLYRITQALYSTMSKVSNKWVPTATNAYWNNYAYDKDGNIQKLVRWGSPFLASGIPQLMDSFTYRYNGDKVTNVYDNGDPMNSYIGDVNYHPVTTPDTDRMTYDKTGRLTSDYVSTNAQMSWTLYDKIAQTTIPGNFSLKYGYDGAGNRIFKKYGKFLDSTGIQWDNENHYYYVRDAAGNVLSILHYDEQYQQNKEPIKANVSLMLSSGVSSTVFTGLYSGDPYFSGWVLASSLGTAFGSGMITGWTARSYYTGRTALVPYFVPCAMRNLPGQLSGTSTGFGIVVLHGMVNEASKEMAHRVMRDTTKMATATADMMNTWQGGFDSLCHLAGFFDSVETNQYDSLIAYFKHKDSVTIMDYTAGIISGNYSDSVNSLRDSTVKTWIADANLFGTNPQQDQAWIDVQIQAMDRYIMDSNNKAALDTVINYFSNWPTPSGALTQLRSLVGDATLLQVRYDANPDSFANAYVAAFGTDSLGSAIEAIPTMSSERLLEDVTVATSDPGLPLQLPWANVMEENWYGVDELHLYGLSRLGIKYFDPQQVGWMWIKPATYVAPSNSVLGRRQFWYSGALGDFMQSSVSEPVWTSLDYGNEYSNRMLGMKKYELTNHLGDVQTLVLDRLTPVDTSNASLGDKADVPMSLDYYPYGMPLRYAVSTLPSWTHVPVSTVTYAPYAVSVTPDGTPPMSNADTIGDWSVWKPSYSNVNMSWGGTGNSLTLASTSGQGSIPPSGMHVVLHVDSTQNYTVNLTVNTNNAGALLARVVKYLDTTWQNYQVLAQTNVQGSGKYTLSFTAPSGGNTYLWVGTQAGMTTGMSYSITTAVVTGYTSGITVMLADETQSAVPDYRYGNDGQERDDEVAGPGNHYTALFTQYDPRLVMRPIPDPKPTIGVSPYVSFGDNPISNVDPLGDTTNYFNNKTGKYLGTVMGDDKLSDKFIDEKTYSDITASYQNKLNSALSNVKGSASNSGELRRMQKSLQHTNSNQLERALNSSNGVSTLNLNSDLGLLSRIGYAEFRGGNSTEQLTGMDITMNRVGFKKYGSTLNEVITNPYQYSSLNKNDPNKVFFDNPYSTVSNRFLNNSSWTRSVENAQSIINGVNRGISNGATLYYSPRSMNPPGSLPRHWDFSILTKEVIPGIRDNYLRAYKEK